MTGIERTRGRTLDKANGKPKLCRSNEELMNNQQDKTTVTKDPYRSLMTIMYLAWMVLQSPYCISANDANPKICFNSGGFLRYLRFRGFPPPQIFRRQKKAGKLNADKTQLRQVPSMSHFAAFTPGMTATLSTSTALRIDALHSHHLRFCGRRRGKHQLAPGNESTVACRQSGVKMAVSAPTAPVVEKKVFKQPVKERQRASSLGKMYRLYIINDPFNKR